MRLIDADKLHPDVLTRNGSLAISQNQIAEALTINSDSITSVLSACMVAIYSHAREHVDGKLYVDIPTVKMILKGGADNG